MLLYHKILEPIMLSYVNAGRVKPGIRGRRIDGVFFICIESGFLDGDESIKYFFQGG